MFLIKKKNKDFKITFYDIIKIFNVITKVTKIVLMKEFILILYSIKYLLLYVKSKTFIK